MNIEQNETQKLPVDLKKACLDPYARKSDGSLLDASPRFHAEQTGTLNYAALHDKYGEVAQTVRTQRKSIQVVFDDQMRKWRLLEGVNEVVPIIFPELATAMMLRDSHAIKEAKRHIFADIRRDGLTPEYLFLFLCLGTSLSKDHLKKLCGTIGYRRNFLSKLSEIEKLEKSGKLSKERITLLRAVDQLLIQEDEQTLYVNSYFRDEDAWAYTTTPQGEGELMVHMTQAMENYSDRDQQNIIASFMHWLAQLRK